MNVNFLGAYSPVFDYREREKSNNYSWGQSSVLVKVPHVQCMCMWKMQNQGDICKEKPNKYKSLCKNRGKGHILVGKQTKSICANEKSEWKQNNGVKLKQRLHLLVGGTEWQRFNCVHSETGTAVRLYKDEDLRWLIVSPYLGHGSAVTKRHCSQSPCLCGQIIRMFLHANTERDWESHQIKQCHHGDSVWSCCCCKKAEWTDLSPHFVLWYSFSVGCLCLCQCWQAQFHSRPWLSFVPRRLLESIKALHCRTYCPQSSAVWIQTSLDVEGNWKVGFLGKRRKYVGKL